MNAVAAMVLRCNSGQIVAHIGDQWPLQDARFEIVGLTEKWVTCRPVTKVPARLRDMVQTDGLINFTPSAVASALLTKRDGKARDPHGTLKAR